LEENQTGLCLARGNVNNEIVCLNYGRVTSLALDPIEKKPLYRFFPGMKILSVGSFGCNMKCGFCQNYGISMVGSDCEHVYISPEELVQKSDELVSQKNIGIAFTYNEPLIGYEYVVDVARINKLKTVLVTNGLINEKPLMELLPYIDAMNIDLKCFSSGFYEKLKGDFEMVKRTIELSVQQCHVEVTTLIIPGENDSVEEITQLCKWLGSVNKDIPLHLSRFFPRYRYSGGSTEVSKIYELCNIAKEFLNYVYAGNV